MHFNFGSASQADALPDGVISIVLCERRLRIRGWRPATAVIKHRHLQEIGVNHAPNLADQTGSERPAGWLMAEKLHPGASPRLASIIKASWPTFTFSFLPRLCQNFVRGWQNIRYCSNYCLSLCLHLLYIHLRKQLFSGQDVKPSSEAVSQTRIQTHLSWDS